MTHSLENHGKPWTEADDAQLRALAHLPPQAIAVRLGRTVEAIKSRARTIGIDLAHTRKQHHRTYSDREAAYVRKYAPTRTAEEIGRMIGRSGQSVRQWCSTNDVSLLPEGQKVTLRVPDGIDAEQLQALVDKAVEAQR